MLRRITSGLRIPPFFWGVAFGFLFAILSRRPTPEVGGPLIDTTIISRAAECPACPQSGSPLPCAASSATDLEPISPALLAQGPQSPGTAAYYDPIASTLSRLGPPAPSCFEGLDKPPAVPRKWDTVLIIAQGRSGSTSLLRLLNTLPCYNIRGENPNVFTYVVGKGPRPPKKQTGDTYMQAVGMIAEKMEPWQEKWHDTDMKQKPSWFNRLDVPRSNAVVRLLVSETLEHVPDRVTSGFKSITLFSPRGQNYNISRWFMDDWIRLFPRTGVVFITRKGVENSGWWRVTGNSAGLMATQAEWFARFHQEIPQRYKKDSLPKQRVESVMVDYDDLVKCRHVPGSTLEAMYQMLGETWDPSRCKAVMGTNIEDWGVAMSEFEFSGVQGEKSWTYGYREVPLGSLDFGPFVPLQGVQNSSFTNEVEWTSRPYPTAPPLTLGRALHLPSVAKAEGGGWKMAVPCRIWKPWGAMKADVEVRVPALLPACESTHAGYIAALLISGKLVKNAEHHLGSQGGSFKVPADLAVEDQVELCLVPTFGPDQGKGHRICAPVLSSLVMLRGGTG